MAKFFDYIDLNKNEVRNSKAQSVAGTPGGLVSGDAGIFWYDSTAGRFKYWDGTQVIDPASDEGPMHLPARVRSIGNITIASPGASIDGKSLVAGDRVLLTNQTTATENGLWVWNASASPMTRPADWTSATETILGASVFVFDGSTSNVGIYTQPVVNIWTRITNMDLGLISGSYSTSTDVSLASHKLTNVTDPAAAQDAATKNYVDNNGAPTLDWKNSVLLTTAGLGTFPSYTASGSGVGKTLTGTANAALVIDTVTVVVGNRILVKDATASDNGIYTVTQVGSGAQPFILTRATDADASTKLNFGAAVAVEGGAAGAGQWWYLSGNGSFTLDTTNQTWKQATGLRLDQILAPTSSVSLNSQRITSLLDPGAAQDAATKNYVDSVATGMDWKASVRLVATSALPTNTASGSGVGKTLTATANAILSIDGTTTVAGDRVLITAEATGANNGIYTVTQVGTGSLPYILTRATDADSNAEVTSGLATFVEAGTSGAGSLFVLSTANPIVVDTTVLAFTSMKIPPAGGGLGKYSALIGNGSLTAFTITAATHLRGTFASGLHVQVEDASTGEIVHPAVTINSTGDVTITFTGTTPATNSYRVVIIG